MPLSKIAVAVVLYDLWPSGEISVWSSEKRQAGFCRLLYGEFDKNMMLKTETILLKTNTNTTRRAGAL